MIKIGQYYYKNLLAYILVKWFKKPNITIDERVEIESLTKIRLCRDYCFWLRPKEVNQTSRKESHTCIMYNKRLIHGSYHPHLIACEACDSLSVKKEYYI